MADNELEFSSNFKVHLVLSDTALPEIRLVCVCGDIVYSNIDSPAREPVPLATLIDGAEDHEARGCRR